MKIAAIAALAILSIYSCGSEMPDKTSGDRAANSFAVNASEAYGGTAMQTEVEAQTQGPKNVRDFFMLLPSEYFLVESCVDQQDKECKKEKEWYLRELGEVIDIPNGYIKGGCDGAQTCMEMALFKRPDGTYLIGLATHNEGADLYNFLDYENKKWTDISKKVIPQFSKDNMYELPRYGTTVQVFAKVIIESGEHFDVSNKGKKLYDLEWKDGKFTIKR